MIDGTYKIDIEGPLGRKSGKVTLRTEGDTVYADIDAPIIGKQHTVGSLGDDVIEAEGTFKIRFIGEITYSLNGVIEGDDLRFTIDSNKGKFEITGTRI